MDGINDQIKTDNTRKEDGSRQYQKNLQNKRKKGEN